MSKEDCFNESPQLKPNGDVSGPGVLVGFFGTGWFVTALVIVYYLVGFDPSTQSADNHGSAEPLANLDSQMATNGSNSQFLQPNPIDEIILALFHGITKKLFSKFPRCLAPPNPFPSRQTSLKALEKIVTGLGIMTAGYIELAHGNFAAYHWRLIIYLAWFSNLTHQAALIFLRGYLRDHPHERLWRFCLMTLLVVMLLVALLPTAFFNWQSVSPVCPHVNEATPARCFYDLGIANQLYLQGNYNPNRPYPCRQIRLTESDGFQSAVVSAVVLISSYTLRSIRLFAIISAFIQHTLRAFLAGICRKSIAKLLQWQTPCRVLGGPLWSLLVLRPVLALYLLGRLSLDFFTSVFCDICWLVISAVVGTIRLFRAKGGDDNGEATWTFGQILAVFLLIGPLLMFSQALLGHSAQDSSPKAATGQCLRCSQPVSADNTAGTNNDGPGTAPLQMDEPTDHEEPQHFYTTRHLDFDEEINNLFQRDYYNEFVWIVFAILSFAFIPIILLAVLVVFLISKSSILSFPGGFALPLITSSVACYNMIVYGLLIEGWRFEFEASAIGLAIAYVCSAISVALGFRLANAKELWPYDTFITVICVVSSFGSLILYVIICPLAVWVLDCAGMGYKRATNTRQSQTTQHEDRSHEYLNHDQSNTRCSDLERGNGQDEQGGPFYELRER